MFMPFFSTTILLLSFQVLGESRIQLERSDYFPKTIKFPEEKLTQECKSDKLINEKQYWIDDYWSFI